MIEPHLDWLDPIHGVGYQFWSGIGGSAFLAALIYFTPDICEQLGCYRLARELDLDSGAKLCRKHLRKD